MSLASAFQSDEDRKREIEQIKKAASKRYKDFVSLVTHDQKLQRQAKMNSGSWSHVFIINNATTAWYDGPQLKFYVMASEPEQLVSRVHAQVKKLMDIPTENQLVIK